MDLEILAVFRDHGVMKRGAIDMKGNFFDFGTELPYINIILYVKVKNTCLNRLRNYS